MGLFDFLKKKDAKPQASDSSSTAYNDVMPIEKRIRSTQPTCDGLFPHEILVLSYAESYTTEDHEFSGFWQYKYGINDVQAILRKLNLKGYLVIGNIEDVLENLKMPTLKQLLQERNLKVSGKKAELIERILENVSLQELESRFKERPYKLTDTGKTTLDKFEWIPYIHRHYIDGLDIWNLTCMVQTPPYTKYRDKIWRYLNQLGVKYAEEGNWGLYRNSRFQMSEFVMEEEKPEIAFNLLCEVMSYDLSGIGNGFKPQFMASQYEYYFPYEKSIVKTAPGILDRIAKLADEFGWSENQLRDALIKAFDKYSVQYGIFTSEEKAGIVIAEMRKDIQTLNSIYSISQKQFKKKYGIK